MKNITQYVENLVRDQIATSCAANGIDKGEVGYAVTGCGQLAIIPTPNGNVVTPAWTVLLSIRHLLLGQPALAVPVPVTGVLPSDADFRTMVDQGLAELVKVREAEFNGRPTGNGPIDPEQVIVIGKDQLA